MNFSLYKVENTNTKNSLFNITKQKRSFFKRDQKDVEIFHSNDLNENMVHIVFHIPDEYHFGTKRKGHEVNVPFSQYINAFLFFNSSYFLLELVNEKYNDEIVKYINQKTKMNPKSSNLDKNKFEKIVSNLNGFIKEVVFNTPDEEEEIVNSIKAEKFYDINRENRVYSVLLSVENEFVSLKENGTISVSNSDDEYLIKFTEAIVNAIS